MENLLQTLENEIGEPLLYRTTAQFLGADGVGEVPLHSWGLLLLTPTRLVYRRFAQTHPLFGGKESELRWEVARSRFDTCVPVLPSFWSKIFSGASDHVSITGSGTRLALETADDQRVLPRAWSASS